MDNTEYLRFKLALDTAQPGDTLVTKASVWYKAPAPGEWKHSRRFGSTGFYTDRYLLGFYLDYDDLVWAVL